MPHCIKAAAEALAISIAEMSGMPG